MSKSRFALLVIAAAGAAFAVASIGASARDGQEPDSTPVQANTVGIDPIVDVMNEEDRRMAMENAIPLCRVVETPEGAYYTNRCDN